MYLVVGIILCLWIYWLWTRRKFYALMLKFPGPIGYPIFGMAHCFLRREEIIETFHYYEELYGHTVFSWLGPYPFLVVSDPGIIQDILTSHSCVNKGLIYDALNDGIGKGLFSSTDTEWTLHRKLLNPAFGPKVLLSFLPTFNEEVDKLLCTLDVMVGKESVCLMDVVQQFTLTVAIKTSIGRHIFQGIAESRKNLTKSYQCLLENLTKMCFSPWLNYSVIRRLIGTNDQYTESKKVIHQFIKESIQRKLSTDSNLESNRDVVTKNLVINIAVDLVKRGVFTWKNVEDELNVIVFGAFETTANTIVYTLIMLAMFPEYQAKCFEELKTMFPDRDNFDVAYSNIQDMVYMDMVLNETMRILTPVPFVSRQTSDEVKLTSGVVLPKGLQIAIDLFHLHRRVDIWGSEANQFNPENFLPSNICDKHPYAFVPFTKGIRNCIGWRYALISTKVALAKLLRNFKFTTDFAYEKLEFVEGITLKLKKVPRFHIQRRDS